MKKVLVGIALLSLGFIIGLVVTARMSSTERTWAAPAGQIQQTAQIAPIASALPDLSAVAQRAIGASVNIASSQQVRQQVDPLVQMFYGRQFATTRPQVSLGSGVIVSSDGYVLTNNHVISENGARTTDIKVTLSNGHELAARIVGADELSDLAVVKIDQQNLPTLTWADSSKLKVAEWVLAIGNPFQLSQTVTLGIVSAVGRNEAELGTYTNLIQTDAAINPGNSGGALINSRGELVGINTLIYSKTGGYQGIGFAIPANLAQRIMAELIKNHSVTWGSIGAIDFEPLTNYAARQLGVSTGIWVYEMDPASSAYKSGLRPDDVVQEFNSLAISDVDQLRRAIADAPIGSKATVEVVRNGRKETLAISVESTAQQRGGQ